MIQRETKHMLQILFTLMLCLTAFFAVNTEAQAETSAAAPSAAPEETQKPVLTITDEALFETDYVNGMLTITRFHQPSNGSNITNVVVPAAIDGQKIRAIGKQAFNGCGNLNIYLPDTLESINDNAFDACPIDAIQSYTYISDGIFAEAESAAAESAFVETPKVETSSVMEATSLPRNLTYIGTQAFRNCSVKNITFNSTGLTIGTNAFEGTGNLLDVVVTEAAHILDIGDFAFLNSGIHTFTVHGSIDRLGNNAFQGTANITRFEVTQTGNIISIGNSAFETSGIHYIILQGTVSNIGDRAFASCGNILDLTVNSSTSYTIGEYAFQNAGIHSVHLSDGLSTVEKGTFDGCGNLETVILPPTVTHIEEDAFKNVSNIKEITLSDTATVDPSAFAGAGGSTLDALAKTNNSSVKTLLGLASAAPTSPPINTTPLLAAPAPETTPEPTVTVSAVKLKKAKVKKKKVTLTWTKNKKASGYTVYRKVVKKGTKAKKAKKIKFVKVKNVSKKNCKLTIKLAKKATTQFYVKAFVKSTVNGKTVTYYSKASNIKKVTKK